MAIFYLYITKKMDITFFSVWQAKEEPYMVVQENVVGEDGGVPDA